MTKTSSNKWCYEGVILKRSDGFCNVREAAQILGISIATFNRWRKIYPNFPRKRMFSKRTILYSIDELNAWLDRPAIEGTGETKDIYINNIKYKDINNIYTSVDDLLAACDERGLKIDLTPKLREDYDKVIQLGLDVTATNRVLTRLASRNLDPRGLPKYLLTTLKNELPHSSQQGVREVRETEAFSQSRQKNLVSALRMELRDDE